MTIADMKMYGVDIHDNLDAEDDGSDYDPPIAQAINEVKDVVRLVFIKDPNGNLTEQINEGMENYHKIVEAEKDEVWGEYDPEAKTVVKLNDIETVQENIKPRHWVADKAELDSKINNEEDYVRSLLRENLIRKLKEQNNG